MARIGKRSPVIRDATSSAFLAATVAVVAHPVDAFEAIAGWPRQHEEWHAGVLRSANLSLAFALAVLAWRRSADLPSRLDERRLAEEALRARE